ncbi:MAG: M20/M25/M40 family metallo-hydrolase [Myxococcota bacterium]
MRRMLLAAVLLTGCAHPAEPAPAVAATASVDALAPHADDPLAGPRIEAVDAMLAQIDPPSLRGHIERLVAFGTRHTLSETASKTRGIGAARRAIAATMKQSPALQVRLDPHRIEPDGRRVDAPTDVVNVVAVLPGTLPDARDRHVYVIGHYDSRVTDPMNRTDDAPGANDDGSGTAVVMELARVMSQHEYDATLVFMATAGEEQGLLGARAHAQAAKAQGVDIVAVLSNDIVGDPTGPSGAVHDDRVRVFSIALPPWLLDEDLGRLRTLAATHDGPSRQLARYVHEVGRRHALPVQAQMVFRRDRFLRGGDHTAFNEAGYAAVRFSEVEENYDRQHQDVRTEDGRSYGDLLEHVNPDYLAGVARLNAAAAAHLANAPSAPADARIVADTLRHDTLLRWTASPESDVAGYEVVWRDTTQPQWTHARDVGNVTEATMPMSKDNVFFGIRAYDVDGYRSLVRFTEVGRS